MSYTADAPGFRRSRWAWVGPLAVFAGAATALAARSAFADAFRASPFSPTAMKSSPTAATENSTPGPADARFQLRPASALTSDVSDVPTATTADGPQAAAPSASEQPLGVRDHVAP